MIKPVTNTLSKRLSELDGLRGLAALSVCIFHFNLFRYGVTGVDLFFMISGFVIYMSVLHAKTIKKFWQFRFIRLYPVYWLSIIIAILSIVFIGHQHVQGNWRFLLGNFTMMQPIFRCKELVDAYWTLYVELVFYALMSLIWALKLLDNIEHVILSLLAVFCSLIVSYKIADPTRGYAKLFIIVRGLFPLISHFHMFAAGVVFYLIKRDGFSGLRIVILIISLLMVLVTHNIGGRVFYYLNIYEHFVCCAIFFVVFILIIREKAALLTYKVFILAGEISFALYVIHQSFGTAIYEYLSQYTSQLIAKAAGVILSFIAAYSVTYYYDFPVRSFLKKYFSK